MEKNVEVFVSIGEKVVDILRMISERKLTSRQLISDIKQIYSDWGKIKINEDNIIDPEVANAIDVEMRILNENMKALDTYDYANILKDKTRPDFKSFYQNLTAIFQVCKKLSHLVSGGEVLDEAA